MYERLKAISRRVFMTLGVIFAVLIVFGIVSASISRGDKIAVVDIEGVITNPNKILKDLYKHGNDDRVKAIILRINSPGGAVGPSQEIYAEVKKLREKKKVVAAMGSVAASGGYYIACAADTVFANPGTITGSIGVIMEFLNFEELFKKVGLKGQTVKSGKFKDAGSPLRDMTPEEEAYFNETIKEVHGQFVSAVAEGRRLKKEAVEEFADGRVFTGEKAKTLGLVDKIGTFSDAIDESKRLAGIEGKVDIIYPKKNEGLAAVLFGDAGAETLAGAFDATASARLMYRMPQFSR